MIQPTRNGSAARFLFGDSKIKIITVIGTELRATATAIGSSAPSACHIALTVSPTPDSSATLSNLSRPKGE